MSSDSIMNTPNSMNTPTTNSMNTPNKSKKTVEFVSGPNKQESENRTALGNKSFSPMQT